MGEALAARRSGYHTFRSYPHGTRGVAQSGSALGWGPSGRWFESSRPDSTKPALRRGSRVLLVARRGPGWLCELEAAQEMWEAKWNPVSQRPCEMELWKLVEERPLPTLQIGVITARAVAFARKLAARCRPPSGLERGEVLEVYPRATLRRLAGSNPKLAPKVKGEPTEIYLDRIRFGLARLVDGLDEHETKLRNPHVLDGLIAAYTAWLSPAGLEPPPAGFNLASGWIWFPRAVG
jgi:Protein of unknown function (DUF429)